VTECRFDSDRPHHLNQTGILRLHHRQIFCAANDVLPHRVAGCIKNDVKDINRVVRDVTIKPTVKIRMGATVALRRIT
jgi:hypothetical protein